MVAYDATRDIKIKTAAVDGDTIGDDRARDRRSEAIPHRADFPDRFARIGIVPRRSASRWESDYRGHFDVWSRIAMLIELQGVEKHYRALRAGIKRRLV